MASVVSPRQATRREWAERAAAKLVAAQETLAAEVTALRSGEDWKRFLDFQAKLHVYSPANTTLIAAQHAQAFADGLVGCPDPGYVAGFATWRALGRTVERGQHGYMILAPCRYDRRVALDADGSARRLDRGDVAADGERVESRRILAGFRVEHVFSMHQTSGAALPDQPLPQLLVGEAPPGLGAAVLDLIESRGFTVETVADSHAIGGANGVTRWDTRSVLIHSDIDDAAMVKTLIHEAAHVLAHAEAPGRFLPRPLKEVEAESIAYVVAAVHGMPTDGYSFPYVAAWAGEDASKAVTATQARVTQVARAIIEASPAPHASGGRPPGADAAIAASRSARVNLEAPLSASSAEAAAETAGAGL